ncbi:hypothetical protein GB937_007509 [Aspergillus fischeri]|nr:hypothetical protein GB937_007509 [Aspergillus fischeri]
MDGSACRFWVLRFAARNIDESQQSGLFVLLTLARKVGRLIRFSLRGVLSSRRLFSESSVSRYDGEIGGGKEEKKEQTREARGKSLQKTGRAERALQVVRSRHGGPERVGGGASGHQQAAMVETALREKLL